MSHVNEDTSTFVTRNNKLTVCMHASSGTNFKMPETLPIRDDSFAWVRLSVCVPSKVRTTDIRLGLEH